MAVDSLPSRRKGKARLTAESGTGIKKRSPLEQAIAEKSDRRVRYEATMRLQGFKRTTIWVREDCLRELQALVHTVNGPVDRNLMGTVAERLISKRCSGDE